MSRKIKVLVVDDMAIIRRILTEVLSGEADIEVIGTAPNGRIALAKLPLLKPDILILDFDMPEMNGLETLIEIRKHDTELPVIIFSALTEKGATLTLDALSKGADDYITKPEGLSRPEEGLEKIRQELVPRIRALVRTEAPVSVSAPPTTTATATPTPAPVIAPRREPTHSVPSRKVDILAIGVSTGGPNALGIVLPQLPADFPIPIVIVQHMPKIFTKLLAERLNEKGKIRVFEATSGQVLRPGEAVIAPGDFHMVLRREGRETRIETHQAEAVNFCRPSVDVLFESVSKLYGANVLGLIMTGMGQDGLKGCEGIKTVGGQVVVQDAASSVVWGMPGAVANAGIADEVLALEMIPAGIIRRVIGQKIYAQ